MNKYNLSTPVGLSDYALSKMEKKNKIETELKELYLNAGYNLIETPTLEYLDVFSSNIQNPSLYKLINKDGEILSLRSDVTKSIARVVSTETKSIMFPQRFCYITNCFRYPKAYQGRSHEFTQAGIELIGENSIYADYEIVSLAVKSLQKILPTFKLYISSTEFFKNFLDDLNINDEVRNEILTEISNKNVVKIKKLLSDSDYKTISFIIEAIGKKEMLQSIKETLKSEKTKKSLERLELLYSLLEENGLVENVYFDFSVLSYGTYYTGITLQGYTKGVGTPILEGGRYDNLISEFGESKAAIGFAIYENDIINKTMLTYERNITLLFSTNKENAIKANKNCSLVSLDNTLEDAKKYGIINNVKTIIDLDNNKTYILEDGEYICQK